RSRIGNTKDRVGLLDVVGDAEPRLRLTGNGDAVIQIATDSKIEVPVALRDGVLDVESELLHIRVPEEPEVGACDESGGAEVGRRQRRRPREVVAAEDG